VTGAFAEDGLPAYRINFTTAAAGAYENAIKGL
jgi:hypothetical protein